ncbi:MAG: hypothetical protein HYY51_04215 [Candidatus Magasanikbacteria bacterium]|nr:hypothetical protein [Candidatus Magasanikbacteria bacterium]
MPIATQIKTQSVSKTKMAISVAYLGAAVLAASAADIQANNPDLVIDQITVNDSSAYADSEHDTVSIYYSNAGNTENTKVFELGLQFDDPLIGAARVQHMVDYKAEEASQAPATFFLLKKQQAGMLLIPINAKFRSEGNTVSGLNEYRLKPGDKGVAQVLVPRFSDSLTGENRMEIRAVVDFKAEIPELNEKNNELSVSYGPKL